MPAPTEAHDRDMSKDIESEVLIQGGANVTEMDTCAFAGVHAVASNITETRKLIKIIGDELVSEPFGCHATSCQLDRSLTKACLFVPAGQGSQNLVMWDIAACEQLFAIQITSLPGKLLKTKIAFNLAGTRLCLSTSYNAAHRLLNSNCATTIYDAECGDTLWTTELPVGSFVISFDDSCLLSTQNGKLDLTVIPIIVNDASSLLQPQPRCLFEGLEMFESTSELICHPSRTWLAQIDRHSLTVVDYAVETQLHYSTYVLSAGEACFGATDTIIASFEFHMHLWDLTSNTMLFKVPFKGYFLSFNFANNTFVSCGHRNGQRSVTVHDATSGEKIAEHILHLGDWKLRGIYCAPADVILL